MLKAEDCINISAKDLSSIIGLNEEIASVLKRLALSENSYPRAMLNLVENSMVTFKWIRMWISKSLAQIEEEIQRLSSSDSGAFNQTQLKVKARGRSGGAIKRSATFKVNKEDDSKLLQNYLLKFIPELRDINLDESPFHSLEKVLGRLLELAKTA